VTDGAVVPRRVVTPTLAGDHGASDGHRGGLLLARIEALLQKPEADLSTVPGDADLREALDLDSMDILAFVAALHERTARAIPESETPRPLTVDGLVASFEADAS
jgi:acyl carrier protein